MAKAKQEKGLALNINALTQEDVPALLAQVDAKIKLLGGSKKEDKEIKVELDGYGKISEIKDVSILIKAFASVGVSKKLYDEAAKKLLNNNQKVPPFTINGVAVSTWETHIQDRVNVVYNQVALDKLIKTKNVLMTHLSEKEKLANSLKAIAEDFAEL